MALGDSITAGTVAEAEGAVPLYMYMQQWPCIAISILYIVTRMPCQPLPLCLPAGFGMMGAQGSLYNDSLEYRVSCSSAEPPA